MDPEARARRAVSGFAPTSTMRALPEASTWVRSAIEGPGEVVEQRRGEELRADVSGGEGAGVLDRVNRHGRRERTGFVALNDLVAGAGVQLRGQGIESVREPGACTRGPGGQRQGQPVGPRGGVG